MYLVLRRLFEIFVSFIALILLMPMFIIVIILIRLTSKGPAIIRQKRIGKNQKLFTLYKFRTMKIELMTKNPVYIEDPSQYVTKVGKLLRKTSIDELPQLLNIFLGSMSLIGPRPSLPTELELIEKRKQENVYLLKPGITGWAQINGRNIITIDEKVAFDSFYVKTISFKQDIKIVFKTISKVILLKDIK